MARSTKTDRAEGFGKQDEVLKEFAKGEDVGHGIDHDCPACRSNRQALKKAGLHASDISGLSSGSAPPPATEIERRLEDAAAVDEPMSGSAPPSATTQMSSDPVIGAASTPDIFRRDIIDDPPSANPPTPEKVRDVFESTFSFQRRLSDALETAFARKGLTELHARFVNELDDVGVVCDLTQSNGRFMLMRGFVPDDLTYHCEIEVGSGRAHVKDADLSTAIRLAILLAIDPPNGALLNSERQQMKLADARAAGHWVGTGIQP